MTELAQVDRAHRRHVEPAMGTVFSFDLRGPAMDPAALDEAVRWLHWVDATFSTYRDDSVANRLGRHEVQIADCPPEVAEVLALCAAAERASGGHFSATRAGRWDPTGVVKGWAVERASDILRSGGSSAHCVDGGGDLQLVGEPRPGQPWRIGIAHPLRPGALCTLVAGRSIAIATSGTAERGTHIVNPKTGRPATDLASLTLVGPRLSKVDGYATAAFAMGPAARDWVETLEGHEAFAVTAAGRCWWTSGFPEFSISGRTRRERSRDGARDRAQAVTILTTATVPAATITQRRARSGSRRP